MEQHTTPRPASSSPTWENLEAWAREQIQQVVQAMLEAEIADLLGPSWYWRTSSKSAILKSRRSTVGRHSVGGKRLLMPISAG
jgi:hypothetical protein